MKSFNLFLPVTQQSQPYRTEEIYHAGVIMPSQFSTAYTIKWSKEINYSHETRSNNTQVKEKKRTKI